MLHNNYTECEYKSYHVILPADPEGKTGELIIGDLNAATDRELIQQHNIKTIITAAAGLEHLQIPSQQVHIVFPLIDVKTEVIEKYFELSYQTIQENIKKGGVLVHCGAGISRSPTLVIAYYMKKFRSTFANAIKFVRSRRSKICPNLGFQLQLKKYQQRLGIDNDSHSISKKTSKIPSQHQQELQNKNVIEAKRMMITFNAPVKEPVTARLNATNPKAFTQYSKQFCKKAINHSSHKRQKIQEKGLFIEGKPMNGLTKSQLFYDPQKYRHKKQSGKNRRENDSFF